MQPFSFSQQQPQQQSQAFGGGGGGTFGGFSSFGQAAAQPQQQQQQQGFGSTFGTPATSAPTGFGTGTTFGGGGAGFGTSTFGTPQQPAGTGGLFGTPQQQQQASTGFGGAATAPTFGTAAQPSTGFGSAGTTGFGGGTAGFGSGTTGTSLFGQTPQTSTAFGSGAPSTFGAQQTGGFGSTLGTSTFGTTQQPSLFSGTQPSTGFGATQPTSFGGATTQSGSWFGTPQTQASTFSGFGAGGTGGLFSQPKTGFAFPTLGQPQPALQLQLQPQQQSFDEQGAFHQSIFGCCKFGDERDAILANFNYISACWGAGKGYFNQGNMPVSYTDKNVIYRFRAVGYSFMYNNSNEDGQVVIHIKKPHSKVSEEETQLITSLQNLIGKPNIFFKITGMKGLNDEVTVIVLTADDKTSLRRILATDLASALLHPQFRPQLENLGIINVSPKVRPSPEQLKAYLDTPPAGLDPRVWKKAQEDNPDPNSMIPIPLLGPEALKNRVDAQQIENHQHSERLRKITEEVANIQNRHSNMQSEIKQLRRKSVLIQHRVISAVVRTLILQRQGIPVQPEEEDLRKHLQELDKQLDSPTHFRGRLNEIMSHIRMQKTALEGRGATKHSVEPATLDQVKDFLSMQQGSIIHLVDTLKACVDYVQKMNEEMVELSEKSPST